MLLASPSQSMNNPFDLRTPCQEAVHEDIPSSVASSPCVVHAFAPFNSPSSPDFERSATIAPRPPELSPHKSYRRHGDGHHKSREHSAPPTLGEKSVGSPLYTHQLSHTSRASDCGTVTCSPPLVKSPFASECGCVQPIEIKLQFRVPLYALFPLISVLAEELAKGASLSSSQVQIVGANASGRTDVFSVVDAYLIPSGEVFSIATAISIAQKFWNHEIIVNETLFGNYSVLNVKYPGLPDSYRAGADGIQKPFALSIGYPKHSKKRFTAVTIAGIAIATSAIISMCLGALLFAFLKFRRVGAAYIFMCRQGLMKGRNRGSRSLLSSEHDSFSSVSFLSSAMTYAATARLFTIEELNRATNEFTSGNVLGEGGFGRVFRGVLDDGNNVAVKVLTRDDYQGEKEFMTEVEILSRLHHRNLVKLIGICREEQARCLVYELVPNGSVESHLHGREKCILDWRTRMRIVLGSARGLAYLHEDSSPCIIHRDFKAANILLDNDFNPKVSDFGLAKVAPDDGKEHLSTKVMGTFGYVAPEYAMTGHLLVKSDVYSYGVVLLEVLSGMKPVDMSRPPGQENLVTWARPLLTSIEGLHMLVDPSLQDSASFDSLAKLAAIASMCVHPEVSDRPSMGEVFQALKLICDGLDVDMRIDSNECTHEEDHVLDLDLQAIQCSLNGSTSDDNLSFLSTDCDSTPRQEDLHRIFSPPSLFSKITKYRVLSNILTTT
ncbi:hypothetical protein KP509_12G039400 [Ceratopteris richardii]|nr:hypothetical protein KP509_12G039400 [Ceratopteris richardii]KAH7423113.1 hypothetical protein KP509_12G039400 [Ceratopteris richardii]